MRYSSSRPHPPSPPPPPSPSGCRPSCWSGPRSCPCPYTEWESVSSRMGPGQCLEWAGTMCPLPKRKSTHRFKGPPAQCYPQIRRKNTLSVLVHSILPWEGENSGFTLSKTPLRYSESLPVLEATKNELWYVFLDGEVVFIHSKHVNKIGSSTLILVVTCG